ncbi:hypothetical protein [Kitasatospora aureofaciens]|uniref:hypothetical protein n=1 Tax=Kitasatospora aureofaciens TaxID=1894 RepID=UPI000527043B|nr:hypothetical protein [Kitasatospora aureofaciens]
MRLVGPVAEGVGEQALPGDLGEQFGADLVTAVDQSGQRGDAFPGEATDAFQKGRGVGSEGLVDGVSGNRTLLNG